MDQSLSIELQTQSGKFEVQTDAPSGKMVRTPSILNRFLNTQSTKNLLKKPHVSNRAGFILDYHFKLFPDGNMFAESFDIEDGYLYAPFNIVTDESNIPSIMQPGLYRCLLIDIINKSLVEDMFEFVVGFPDNKQLYLGSKYKKNIFVCCVSSNNSIYVANTTTKKTFSIDVSKYGVPNDICFDSEDLNIIYVVTNSSSETYSGLLLKIVLDQPTEMVSGNDILLYNIYFMHTFRKHFEYTLLKCFLIGCDVWRC